MYIVSLFKHNANKKIKLENKPRVSQSIAPLGLTTIVYNYITNLIGFSVAIHVRHSSKNGVVPKEHPQSPPNYYRLSSTSLIISFTDTSPPPERYQNSGSKYLIRSFLYAFVCFTSVFSTSCLAEDSPPTAAPRSTT